MAFPSVRSSTTHFTTEAEGNINTHAIPMPATVSAGDLLLVFPLREGSESGSFNTPTGWTKLFDDSTFRQNYAFAKVAGGDESGTTVDFVISGGLSSRTIAIILAIQDWHGTIGDGIDWQLAGSTVDPPSLTTTWGAADNLWIAANVSGSTDWTYNADPNPTSYSGLISVQSGVATNLTTRYSAAVAFRSLNAATEDPGAFATSGVGSPQETVSVTFAIRPNTATGITITGIKEPNEADTLVTGVTNARVKVWYGSDDTGEEDELHTNQTITNGSLTTDLAGGTVDGAAVVEVLWIDGTERKLFITDTTVVDLGSGS